MAYIFSSAALLISIVSFFILFFYVKKRTAADRISPETRREVSQIINEIDRITDRDSELIEDRVKKLKLLLENIDHRIAAHEDLLNNYKTAEETQKKLTDEKKNAAIEAYRELGKKNYTAALKINIAETAAAGNPEQAESQYARKAAELSAAGVPPHEIAKRLHTTINEVEMALFLAASRQAPPPRG
jgi:ABC-type transporter MlaC component